MLPPIEEMKPNDSILEEIQKIRIEMPTEKPNSSIRINFYEKNKKGLFLVLAITTILNVVLIVALLFL